MEYIRKQGFSLNSCRPFRAWVKNHSAATQRPESSKDQRDHCFFSAEEFWGGNTYSFISQGLKSYFVNDAPRWVCFMTWRLFPVTIPRGAVGLSPSWAPHCSLNWSVALGSLSQSSHFLTFCMLPGWPKSKPEDTWSYTEYIQGILP